MVYNKLLTLDGTVFSFKARYQKRRIMITYLLLRSNKESGPYTLNELLQFGLKPYDLIWVNGKSAAWRYPGEITELKEYAPMVEEQPFDRFFKKQGDSPKTEQAFEPKPEVNPQPGREVNPQPRPEVDPEPKREVNPEPKPEVNPEPKPEVTPATKPAVKPDPVTPTSHSAYIPRKSVFVTMPGHQPYAPKPVDEEPPIKKQEPVVVAETISITENPVAAEIKYSQPLDEIKQMYVKTLQERKQKIANRAFIVQLMKKAAVVVVIVAAGVLIGFTLKSNGDAKKEIASTDTATPVQSKLLPVVEEPQSEERASEPVSEQQQKNELTTQSLSSEKTSSEPLFTEEEKGVARKQDIDKTTFLAPASPRVQEKREITIDEPAPGVDIDARTGERNRKVRNSGDTYEEKETVKQSARNEPKAVLKGGELSKLVSVESNQYHVVAFGGIRNLQLTVYNDSKYLLDNVTVELQYLKPSEQPLRTENIQFRAVSPGGSMTIRVPDTNRGIKVLYRITNILSTQSAKETAGL